MTKPRRIGVDQGVGVLRRWWFWALCAVGSFGLAMIAIQRAFGSEGSCLIGCGDRGSDAWAAVFTISLFASVTFAIVAAALGFAMLGRGLRSRRARHTQKHVP